MASTSWKIEKDLCRCCHSDGAFHSLSETCPEDEKERVYSDILRDCLDIEIAPVPGDLCIVTFTICEACVIRLRDVSNFKKQILLCEEKFKDHYSKNFIKVLDESPQIKVEPEYSEIADFSYDDDDGYDVKSDSDETLEFKASILETALRKKGKSKPKQKKEKEKKSKQPKKIKLEESEETPAQKKRRGDDHAQHCTVTEGDDGTKIFTCDTCGNTYKGRQLFKQHYNHVHLKLRPKLRSCYLCPVKVPGHCRARHLEEAHGFERPTCGACGKKFAYPFEVLRHQQNVHMGERRFECSVCDMKFTARHMLVQHEVKHTGVRKFRCEYCEKWFKWKKNLRTHLMMHMNVRRHVCSICQEAFVQQSSLKYHMTKRHPDFP